MYILPIVPQGDALARVRTALESAEWIDGRETVGAQAPRVKHNQQLAKTDAIARRTGRAGQRGLAPASAVPCRRLPACMLLLRFICYAGGCRTAFMYGSVMALPQGDQLRSDIACTVFINTPEEYTAVG